MTREIAESFEEEVIAALEKRGAPSKLIEICADLGIKKVRGRWSKAAQARYNDIGRVLQKLKRRHVVELVKGANGGWKLR